MSSRLTTSFLLSLVFCAAFAASASAPAASRELKHGAQPDAGDDSAVLALRNEVRDKGFITYTARSENGDWDLFRCRPDGSEKINLTRTPDYNEAWPQYSRDGRRLLFRRLLRRETISGNRYGEQGELILANADGSQAVLLGKSGEFPWASWNPDGQQLACLSLRGIEFIDISNRRVLRTLNRKGFFQQLAWSPDGLWLCGVANNFGTGWSIARMEVATGEVMAVNRVDCCTPDWFPDSRNLVFSWRPPGQKANDGNGWTQLWMADAEGKSRRFLFGEDGRHVYGGQISPDGQYVLFTGNMREDGDPEHEGAPMALLRLADAPCIAGESRELRALHPDARDGPMLRLPVGWEPCWTAAALPVAGAREDSSPRHLAASGVPGAAPDSRPPINRSGDTEVAALAAELRNAGGLAFSAPSGQGDWDIFVMRPDGSDRRNLTRSPEFNEAGVRFSPDGNQLLYYRMSRTNEVDNNTYGRFELVLADSDGLHARNLGTGFPWASWSPDGRQIACLTTAGIQIIDVATQRVVRQVPRRGIVQQLVWSPDGRSFVGTANGLGPFWNIGRLDLQSGEFIALSETDRYNCTPDWVPDARRVVYARGIIPQQPGRAELWVASADGRDRHRLYAEESRHIYGACASPDGRYVLFTRSVEDLGKVDHSQTTMAIIRWTDDPTRDATDETPSKHPASARHEPRLDLGAGWEPHWTARWASVDAPAPGGTASKAPP